MSVKEVIYIGKQKSSSGNISRDGGVSVLLGGKPHWMYDDTEWYAADGQMLSFVANSLATQGHGNLVKEQGRMTKVLKGIPQGMDCATTIGYSIQKPWIPLTEEEANFNRRESDGRFHRIVLCESFDSR
jgi:hypothetical protein